MAETKKLHCECCFGTGPPFNCVECDPCVQCDFGVTQEQRAARVAKVETMRVVASDEKMDIGVLVALSKADISERQWLLNSLTPARVSELVEEGRVSWMFGRSMRVGQMKIESLSRLVGHARSFKSKKRQQLVDNMSVSARSCAYGAEQAKKYGRIWTLVKELESVQP